MSTHIKKQSGFTLVEVMVVIAIISFMAAIAIPNLIRAKIDANDTLAITTLRTMSTVTEQYQSKNSGQYPTAMTSLLTGDPQYINYNYCDQTIAGFDYTCTNTIGGYTYTATPNTVGTTGTTTYVITTGGLITPFFL